MDIGLTFEWVLANTWLYDEKTIAWAEAQAAQRATWDADECGAFWPAVAFLINLAERRNET